MESETDLWEGNGNPAKLSLWAKGRRSFHRSRNSLGKSEYVIETARKSRIKLQPKLENKGRDGENLEGYLVAICFQLQIS
jgi:hypothetical protein